MVPKPQILCSISISELVCKTIKKKQIIARQTGIPTTKTGIERRIGKMILKAIFGK